MPKRDAGSGGQSPADYITDLPYTTGYYEHLAPSWMNYVAALNGFAPHPSGRGFKYCELGCGQGFTAVVLAAANPDGQFWAIDGNPEHIANARSLAESCGLTNIEFLDRTIAQAMRRELPAFDFVALHGVWSWVGDDVRRDIVRFAKTRLKPGGILTNSSNALPGWAGVLPLREMMVAYGDRKGGSTLERLREGLAYVKYMAENGARYFTNNPVAVKKLEELLGSDARYLAHEYMNVHWKPEYFSDVLRYFRSAGLSYAGSFPLAGNYSDLSIPPAFQALFSTAGDRETLEVHRDFVLDTRFRVDFYVRAKQERQPDPIGAGLLDRVVFALLVPRDQVSRVAEVNGVKLEVQGPLFEPMLSVLGRRHATLEELACEPELRRFPKPEIAKGLQFLVLAGKLFPGMHAGEAGAGERISAANRALLGKACHLSTSSAVLASKVTGGGIAFARLEALAFAGVREARAGGALDWCLEFLRAHGADAERERDQLARLLRDRSEPALEVVKRLGF